MSHSPSFVTTFVLASLGAGFVCNAQAVWTQVQPTASPSARWQHMMSHDTITTRTVMFGGRPASNAYLADTWEYDRKTWRQIALTSSPPPRWMGKMVYDAARLNSVLFGGYFRGQSLGDTWTWDSLRKRWTKRTPSTSPSARYNPAMAYDPDRKVVVLFGGQIGATYLNDTWEWNGTNWTKRTPLVSPGVRTTSMAYDASRKRMVIFGGAIRTNRYDNQTWEYDGSTWKRITPTTSPPALVATAMGYDPTSQRIVMYGGFNQSFQNVDTTYVYNGRAWTLQTFKVWPSSRRSFDNMVYDPFSKRLRIFGSRTNSGVTAETWEYSNPTLIGTPAAISVATGGTHTLQLNAGTSHASRLYWVLGSITGTSPGTRLGQINVPLNIDAWTLLTIDLANSAALPRARGKLDATGRATAAIVVPKISNPTAIGVKLYSAYFVYDASNNYYMASNPVTLTLTK